MTELAMMTGLGLGDARGRAKEMRSGLSQAWISTGVLRTFAAQPCSPRYRPMFRS